MNLPRIPNHYAVRRYVKIDKGIWRDHDIVSDVNTSNHTGVDPDGNTIPNPGAACAFSSHDITDGAALMQVDVIPDDDVRANGDVIRMSKVYSTANLRGGADLNSDISFRKI